MGERSEAPDIEEPAALPVAPPPPSPVAPTVADVDDAALLPQAGELTPGWQWVVRLAWLGVFVGFSSVWKASRDVGLPTWWIGPLGAPRPLYVSLIPFIAPTLMVMLSFSRSRHLPWLGVGASFASALIAVFDLSPYPGLGIVELVLAGAGIAVSAATFAGRYRSVPSDAG